MYAPVLAFSSRALLVALFFPFSALDKILNFSAAVAQADEGVKSRVAARLLIFAGLGVEIFMSLGVLSGVADRACAAVLAAYCVITAVMWKPFWRQRGFRLVGASPAREMFWDFLKNFAVAGGFLMLALGPNAASVNSFLAAPLASHRPYALDARGPP